MTQSAIKAKRWLADMIHDGAVVQSLKIRNDLAEKEEEESKGWKKKEGQRGGNKERG